MSSFLFLWLAGFIGSFVVVSLVRGWAIQHLLDVPNERSSHAVPTPRGGGIGIVIVSQIGILAVLTLGQIEASLPHISLIAVLVGAGLIALVGWLDDRYSLPATLRLCIQLIVIAGVVLALGAIAQLELPVFGAVSMSPIIATLVCIFWAVGFTNIFNFMDGIDGLAGTQALVSSTNWSVLALALGQRDIAAFCMLIASTNIGFLVLNRPPAKIFMGDVGSTFLGFCLALLPLWMYERIEQPRLLGTGILFVAPFVLDGAFTITRRALRAENVLASHRSHIYQRLVKQGYSHLQITLLYGLFALASTGCGLLFFTASDSTVQNIAAVMPLLIFVLLVVWTIWLERQIVRQP